MNRPDFDTCTLQEAADYCVKKIVEQGGPCHNGNWCKYYREKPDGEHRCVLGWAMPLKMAQENLEFAIHEMFEAEIERLPAVVRNNQRVWYLLQAFHDQAFNPNAYPELRNNDMLVELDKAGLDVNGDHWRQWEAIRQKAIA